MLHEVLLSLAGHPSPLFDTPTGDINPAFPHLSPPELELLGRIGRLSKLHRDINTQLGVISAKHESPICKAVGTAISNVQLERFHRRILDVETSILKKDSKIVGAYNIVPLAAVVGEFDEWPRILEWLWKLTVFIYPLDRGKQACSGSDLINHLRTESQTGYPDIEAAALSLSKVAELAWLRQLSNWLLYGQLPTYGSADFCIRPVQSAEQVDFELEGPRMPKFVSDSTAASILFIGKSLRQISARSKEDPSYLSAADLKSEMDLIPEHQRILSQITFPIASANLTAAIEAIRGLLSKRVLQKLLPIEKVLQIMNLLRSFFLLGHGEFAIALIQEADERLAVRTKSTHASNQGSLKGIAIKSGEVIGILRKTWTSLLALVDEDDDFADLIEMGRDLIQLAPGKAGDRSERHEKGKPVSLSLFNDFLLPVATHLTLSITSPYDLFISPTEVRQYSDLNMYLLAIRRGHMHLSELWKQSFLRKDHPTPKACRAIGANTVAQQRKRRHKRFVEMRKVWATCSASIYLLSELGEYFEGQVIPNLWGSLQTWISKPLQTNNIDDSDISTTSSTSTNAPLKATSTTSSHDPASLALVHASFLNTLSTALLLTDAHFPIHLRTLLQTIDSLRAQILRLQTIQQNLDLEEDEGIFDALGNYATDLNDCQAELDRARKRVDAGARAVVGRLRECGSGDDYQRDFLASEGNEQGGWRAVNGARIERLLMKLEIGRGGDEGGGGDVDDDDE